MKYLTILLFIAAFVLPAASQTISSNAILEQDTLDLTTPCTYCTTWRYSRADSTLYRWSIDALEWQVFDQGTGGGGGDVSSVNGQTGVVVLDPDDLEDSATTNKFTTASDISKLAGIEAGAQVNRKEVPVILFIGESNSGGQALNSALSTYELSPSEKVQILYDTAFQDLDVGTNNQYLHYYSDLVTQLDPATQHGWENGLRKAVDRHSLKDIYLVKAGQGGSIVADWEVADTFTQIFEQKIAYAEADLLANGLKPVYYIWMSFGINDRLATTDTATWKTDTKEWIERIRTTLGQNATVCMTELPPTSATYNTPIQEISAEDELVHYIPTLDLPLDNDNHWGAVGMDSIAQRMFRVFRDTVWNNGAVIPTELTATAATVTGALTRDSIYQSTAASSETVGIVPTYTLLVNATDSGAGVITFGSGGTTGRGRVTEKIGKDNFIVQWQTGTLAQANTVIVYIDSVSTVASSYARANVSIAGAYTVSTGALQRITAASESTVFSGIAADAYMRIRSSGNNCILSHSPDGVTYTDYYTYTNALLTAPDSLYIKCYQAVAGDGTRFADITINPGASITIPSTETLNYEGFTFTRSEGTPGSVVTGTFGDQYVDILTGDLYVKKSGSGNTGWEKQEAGTVTSVGLSMPSIFSVPGSPVTESGTLTASLATQTANLWFLGPSSGGAAIPTFRTPVLADFPASVVWKVGGNAVGATGSIGTTGANIFNIQTNSVVRGSFPAAGGFSVGNGTFNGTTIGVINASAGYRYNNAATSGEYLRGNGTEFVSSTIQEADLPTRPGTDITLTDAGTYFATDNAEAATQQLASENDFEFFAPADAGTQAITRYRNMILITDAAGSTQTQTLNVAGALQGSRVFIKSGAAVSVTFSTSAGNFIAAGGTSSSSTFVITGVGEAELIYASGSWWQIN